MSYCSYYKASVKRSKCWFLVAVLRGFENVSFDRTLDRKESIFEFFVPSDTEDIFLQIMKYMKQKQIISKLRKYKANCQKY